MISLMSSLEWLVGTNPSHNPRHFPESQNHVFLDSGTSFWILARIFGFWEVFSRWAQKAPLKCLIKAKCTYLLHFFSFLDEACHIDYDC